MTDGFWPCKRQRALIEAARVAAERSAIEGHYAPDELVQRMSQEAEGVRAFSRDSTDDRRWQFPFHFSVEVIFPAVPPLADAIAEALKDAGCLCAEPFDGQGGAERTRSLLFSVWAPSGEAALRETFDAVKEALPGALIGEFAWPMLGGIDPASVWGPHASAQTEEGARQPSEGRDFRVSICAAVQKAIPTDVLLWLLSPAGCDEAKCLKRRPNVFVGEFVRFASSQAEAETTALEALRGLFQDPQLVNLDPTPGSSLDAFRMLAKERWRTDAEVASAAEYLEVRWLDPDKCATGKEEPDGDLSRFEGRVFEVQDGLQLAHIRLDDGRIVALTPRTPGLLRGLNGIRLKQRFECVVDGDPGTLLWARPLEARTDLGAPVGRTRRLVLSVCERVGNLLRRRS